MKRTVIFLALLALIATPVLAAPAPVTFQMFGTGTTAAPAASRYVTHVTLTANTAQTITVPTGYKFVNPNANVVMYVNFVTTAVVPAGAVTDGTGSTLVPGARYLGATDGQAAITSFSVISPNAGIATFEWWR